MPTQTQTIQRMNRDITAAGVLAARVSTVCWVGGIGGT
jgi:hypothetical protein